MARRGRARPAEGSPDGRRSFWRRLWIPGRKWYRQRALYLAALPAIILLLAGIFVFAYLFASVPLPEDIGAQASRVLDREGNEVGVLAPDATGEYQTLEDLPEHVPQAVMAAEDRGFYGHRGFSIRGILRALFTNVQAGEIEQGGSTITQQYIKNAALTPDRTFVRKVNELVLAVKMERAYSKDQILEYYLNTIYFGRGAYGIDAAAQTFFGVGAADLTVNQAAVLAGIVRRPGALDPSEHPDRAEERRIYVLDGMAEEGWLSVEEAQAVADEGLPETTGRATVDYGPAAYYMDAVRNELIAELGGEEAVYRGLTVTTELDQRMQAAAQAVLTQQVAAYNEEAQGPLPVSAAMVSVDPADGGVRALVGGPDFGVQPFNAALAHADGTGRNQSGSSFKPFGLAAFIAEGYSPESRFPAPAQLRDVEFPDGREYPEVSNFGGNGYGTQTVREATLTSTNTVFVQMAAEIGADKVEEMAVAAGIPEEWLEPDPSLVLGTSDVSVLSMAEAYATFAAGGVHHEPRLVRSVEDANGEVVLDNPPEREGEIDANVAYAVSDLLVENVQSGTGTAAQLDRPAAGKTGTTDDSLDAWFTGYVPQLATAVWFGNLQNQPLPIALTGSSYPAETWGMYMQQAVEGMEVQEFPEPDLSDLRRLRGAPTTQPGPTATAAPSPQPTECPDGEGGTVTIPLPPGEPCPSPQPDGSPTPSPTDTGTTPPPPPPPPPSPTESESSPPPSSPPPSTPPPSSPSPSGGGGGGGGDGATGPDGTSASPEPSSQPSGQQTQSADGPSPEPSGQG